MFIALSIVRMLRAALLNSRKVLLLKRFYRAICSSLDSAGASATIIGKARSEFQQHLPVLPF